MSPSRGEGRTSLFLGGPFHGELSVQCARHRGGSEANPFCGRGCKHIISPGRKTGEATRGRAVRNSLHSPVRVSVLYECLKGGTHRACYKSHHRSSPEW